MVMSVSVPMIVTVAMSMVVSMSVSMVEGEYSDKIDKQTNETDQK
jgi:hypothetical protein